MSCGLTASTNHTDRPTYIMIIRSRLTRPKHWTFSRKWAIVCVLVAHVVAKLTADIEAASKNVKLSCIPESAIIYKCKWLYFFSALTHCICLDEIKMERETHVENIYSEICKVEWVCKWSLLLYVLCLSHKAHSIPVTERKYVLCLINKLKPCRTSYGAVARHSRQEFSFIFSVCHVNFCSRFVSFFLENCFSAAKKRRQRVIKAKRREYYIPHCIRWK